MSRKAVIVLPIVSLAMALAACASGTVLDKYQSDYVPAGSLRLGQAMQVAKGEEVLKDKQLHDFVTASGVSDSDIENGSIVLARIFCCGGLTRSTSSEVANARVAYVPPELHVGPGDIIEMRVGHAAQAGVPAVMNRATKVVQRSEHDDGSCWWDPRNDRLWLRILYCTWMPKEGWVKQGGINPAWYKPPAGSTGS
jgi:hypothetical protein